MFSDEMIAKIYANPKLQDIPVKYLMETVDVIQKTLEDLGYDFQFQSVFSANGNGKQA